MTARLSPFLPILRELHYPTSSPGLSDNALEVEHFVDFLVREIPGHIVRRKHFFKEFRQPVMRPKPMSFPSVIPASFQAEL